MRRRHCELDTGSYVVTLELRQEKSEDVALIRLFFIERLNKLSSCRHTVRDGLGQVTRARRAEVVTTARQFLTIL